MKIRYWLAQRFFGFIMKVFWNSEIRGLDKVDSTQGVIVCANHTSFLDPPFLGTVFPYEAYYVAKMELFNNKILGKIISYFNAFPIKRKGFVREAIIKSENILNQKKNLIMFPEGSRKSTVAKAGIARIAVNTDCKIYPVQVENIDNFWDCFYRKRKLTFIFKKPFEPGWYKSYTEKDKKIKYKKLAGVILKRIRD
ncbi:MAG: 1-acyl-sn-glycerol-3-phosphate acyltransferase [Candidatus Cloacimonetes bacterium]|nr:1-acyl-sn-glycerol-3-phosphate acyltransferase [Candidatus Cloacimonadota bacterium]MBS3766594.1 1-acyl-sn-glycerol-3-phosphate acyltransferase [Candidatus Cloacimonadota bacterium]